jgi:hypothetical protein
VARTTIVPKEEWRPVVGFEGSYEVSSFGKVISKTRVIKNHTKMGMVYNQARKGRQLIAHDDGHGYLHIRLRKNNKTYNTKVHRLVAKAFLPNPNGLTEVNHKNGTLIKKGVMKGMIT